MTTQQNNNHTKGIETLLGDPKKAIIKLAIPMIIAMSVQTIYNFVDALWVSGFASSYFTSVEIVDTGRLALAAIGFVMPFYMMAIALSTGIGVGSGSAISRKIGATDKEGADNVAIHSIVITLLIAIVFSFILFFFAEPIFTSIGAGEATAMAVSYGKIIFGGSIVIFFINMATSILRGEGDANRAMYAIILGTLLNIILDPIFIFTFKMGISGAAYATILSMVVTALLLIYWLFFRKNTYVSFNFKDFHFKKDILKDIFKVGLPASVQQLSMSFTMIIINVIIIMVALGGENGVAVYSTGWRVVMFGVLPLLGLATAVISVTGAAYGAKAYDKLNIAFMFAIKFGFVIELFIGVFMFIIAPYAAGLFTTAEGSDVIYDDLVLFIKITCLFYPAAALGIASSSMFQGTGKGVYALVATLIRTIFLTIILVFIFVQIFTPAIVGIWWGLVISNIVGSGISFGWAKWFIHTLKQKHLSST